MKIITAIGKKELNEKLKENEDIEVIGEDIPYQEGVFEILETKKDIDTIAVSNILPEEMNFLFFIEQIKKEMENVEIVVFLDKENVSIENFLNSQKIYKIYYLDENGIEIFVNSLKNTPSTSDISKEIEDLKELIMAPNKKRNEFNLVEHDSSIITVLGNPGSGKSCISCMLAKQIEKQKRKVALIDFDNSSKTILGIKKVLDKEIKVSKYLTVFTIEDSKSQTNALQERLYELKREYEYIIIDTFSNTNYKYINTILNTSTKIVFLLEANLLGITKAQRYLEVLINDIKVDVEKIKIVFNKTSKYQIAESVLGEIFSNFEEIGNISYDERYNLFMNHNAERVDMSSIYEIVC